MNELPPGNYETKAEAFEAGRQAGFYCNLPVLGRVRKPNRRPTTLYEAWSQGVHAGITERREHNRLIAWLMKPRSRRELAVAREEFAGRRDDLADAITVEASLRTPVPEDLPTAREHAGAVADILAAAGALTEPKSEKTRGLRRALRHLRVSS